MQHRGHALKRRYGRSSGRSYAIQQSGSLFLVKLTEPLEVSGKVIPLNKTLGTINERGTISVWRSAGYNPRGYAEAARSLLDAARSDLKAQGLIMAKERAREAAEEQATGSFIVEIDGGPTIRGHDMPRTRAKVEQELLGRPVGTKARFYRAQIGDTPRTGIPWTEPFHVEEVYEWNGQKRVRSGS